MSNKKIFYKKNTSFKSTRLVFSERTHLCKNPSVNYTDFFKMAAFQKPQVFSRKAIFLLLLPRLSLKLLNKSHAQAKENKSKA
jgi:hypothetical protein